MAKKEKLFSKVLMILLLIVIAVGFTIPMLDFGGESQIPVEPRICKFDADCYLICNEQPLKVFCSQNLCQQNSCAEEPYYTFNDIPINFKIKFQNSPVSLLLEMDDIFVQFDGVNVKYYSRGLTLANLFERVGMIDSNYDLFVNGQQSYAFANYIPAEGDNVVIDFKVDESVIVSGGIEVSEEIEET
ncbi:hypothetical protein COY27_06855 [Candidatus Woesearchaeota archaeon CG_4_10_14_0_2_um_filter_33_13]|nr:MAG: hypothetical protein COY27_06855 [Candidatus Woesearchaeota archaeon CG_4_10_14_0_2_um_filter_33_13]